MAGQQAQDVAAYVMFDAEGNAYAIPVEELDRFKLSDDEKAEAMNAEPSNGDSGSEVQGYAMNYRQHPGIPSPYFKNRKGQWQFNPNWAGWAEPTMDA